MFFDFAANTTPSAFESLAVMIPIISPLRLITGPPLLPGFADTVNW
jgi:hypothetical protein